ncbi:hypothetical protein U1Q18_017084, partial [Sarracenia purpurea var. burkii]
DATFSPKKKYKKPQRAAINAHICLVSLRRRNTESQIGKDMASAMRSSVRPLGPSAITTTTTLTLDHFLLFPSSTQEQQQQQQPSKALTLRLNRRTKKVTWKEGTIDNEFLQKKSSKKCCIFHKEKPFDEDDSDTDAENQSNGNDRPNKVHHRHPDDVCCLIGNGEN